MLKIIYKLGIVGVLVLSTASSVKGWEYSEQESNARYTDGVVEDIRNKYDFRVGVYERLHDRARRKNQELIVDEKVIHNPVRVGSYLERIKHYYWRSHNTSGDKYTLIRDYYRYCTNQELQGISFIHDDAERNRDPIARGGKQTSYYQAETLYTRLIQIIESKSNYCNTVEWNRITFR